MFTDLGIYALLVAMIVYAIVVCVMNDFFMKKYLEYKNPWKAAYVSPLIASAVMGVVAAGVYYGFHAILPSNIICLGVSIILAAAAYFLVYILVDKTASERLSSRCFLSRIFSVKMNSVQCSYNTPGWSKNLGAIPRI